MQRDKHLFYKNLEKLLVRRCWQEERPESASSKRFVRVLECCSPPQLRRPMRSTYASPAVVRFGVFEAELRAGELRRSGVKVRIQDLPFRALALLLPAKSYARRFGRATSL